MTRRTCALTALAGILFLGTTATARAERVRFHYTAPEVCNPGHVGAPAVAERITMFGGREPVQCNLRPTHVVSYRHLYTGATVAVPIRFPEDIPLIQHRGDRVIYNYGSYSIEVVFVPDGSVDVVYNSGWGRPLDFCCQ